MSRHAIAGMATALVLVQYEIERAITEDIDEISESFTDSHTFSNSLRQMETILQGIKSMAHDAPVADVRQQVALAHEAASALLGMLQTGGNGSEARV